MRCFVLRLLAATSLFASANCVPLAETPGCYSRDKGIRTFSYTNGVFHLKLDGELDWAVSPYTPIPVVPGERFTFSVNTEQLETKSSFHLSVVLRSADGRVRWGYAVQPCSTVGRVERTFLVPSGVQTIQPRICGHGKFAGRISGVELRRVGKSELSKLPACWTLSNARLEVKVHRDGGRLTVTDRKSGRTWAPLVCAMPQEIAATGVRCSDNRLSLDLFNYDTERTLHATFVLDGAEVVAELTAPAESRWSSFVFPAPFAPAKTDALIVPMSEGFRLPFNETHPRLWNASAWNASLAMPFFGVVDAHDKAGWMAILETPNDARMRPFYSDGGSFLGVAPEWVSEKETFAYTRRARFVFFAEGGYVAMAKRYRAVAQREGLVRTLREKSKTVPQLDILVGAPNIWYFRGKGEPNALAVAKELRAAGFDRMLWSQTPADQTAAQLVAMGNVLASRYDVYRDVYRPEMYTRRGMKVPTPTAEICANTSAWPNDVILNKPGDTNSWAKAWPIMINGEKVNSSAMCTLVQPKYLRRNLNLELKRAAYNCRFVDVTAAHGWEQCWSERHPMTRTQSRAAATELLGLLAREYRLVAGSEQGMGALVPVCDYFEGMLSPSYARMPHGRPGAGRSEIFRGKTNVTPRELDHVAKYGVDGRYRIPLFELVFHDCCCSHWYWYDYTNRPVSFWLKRDLLNILYGTAPMYAFDYREWQEQRAEFCASYQRVAPVARRTGYSEMLDHRALNPARTVQQTTFADGTVVVVNFGDTPFTLPDGRILSNGGWKIENVKKELNSK